MSNGRSTWTNRAYEWFVATVPSDHPPWRRHSVALLLGVAAVIVRVVACAVLGDSAPLTLSHPAVVLSAWYGGLWPGLITTTVSTLGGMFVVNPMLPPPPNPAARGVATAAFVLTGVLVSCVFSLLRQAAQRTNQLERTRLVQEEQRAEERSRSYAVERRARIEAEASDARHRFLAEASTLLASSPEYEANLRDVAARLLPAFADACVVQLFDAEGHARRIAAFHAVVASSEALERLCAACAAGTGPPGLAAILGVTEPRLVEARDWVEQATSDPERELLSQIDAASALGVPLRTRGRVLGLLTLLASPARPSFGEKELGFAVDLADRAAIAIDNALLLSEAQRINRIKDEFLALLSHELRTPLGAILLWTGLLETENLDAAPARAVDMIDRSTRQLSQLIGELLDVSRIVAGKLSLDPHATLLGNLVESAVAAQRPAAEAKGVLLRFMSAGTFPQAWADSNRLRQALDNLVVNAIKFTPAQGEIVVSLERLGNSARVRVRDTGAGMRPELLPLIFERFRQGDSSSRRGQGGLGLGLTIAQHIVHLHGGTISAWSEGEGRGSVFTMQIPLRLAPSAVVSSASDPRQVDKPLAGHRVLVVDDHEDTLRGLSLALEHNGAEVLKASSVDEGLTGLAGFRPDVIVSDLAMPDRDGYDLIGAVRALAVDDGGSTPAVAVSAYASNEDRQRALDAGFQEHLAKPVDVPRLVQSLVRLMAAV